MPSNHDTASTSSTGVGRRIELSQAGRTFLVEAKATQQSARLSELALIELGGLHRGTLSIQASQTIASYWLPPFLVAFKAAYPDIMLVMHEGNSAAVAKAVLEGAADLGFVEGTIDDAALATTPLPWIAWSSCPIIPLRTSTKCHSAT